MIGYRIIVPAELRTSLAHLHPGMKVKVRASLRLLEQDPLVGKPLERELSGYRSYPIPPYRIVYRIEPSGLVVRLVWIGHRRDIYEILVHKLNAGEVRERRAIYIRK